MANNYLQFSFMVENVTPEGAKYFEKLCDEYEEREEMEPCQYAVEEFPEGIRLWLYAEEYGDPDALGDILSSYLERYDPEGIICFSWAVTCSKLRLDEFGGGAMVITKDIIHGMNTDGWIHHKTIDIKAERAGDRGIYGHGS